MGSHKKVETAVNGVVDPAADVTKPSKPTKATEMQNIPNTVAPDIPAAAAGTPPARNGSVASAASVAGEATDAARTVATPFGSPGIGDPAEPSNPEPQPPSGDPAPGHDTAAGYQQSPSDAGSAEHADESADDPEADDDWIDEYHDAALFSSIFSAPSLALAGFVFALTGLLGGMIPESLPYLIQIDPSQGPAFHVRILGLIALGFAIIAASLGLAATLRAIGSPLRWPRYLGGAAVLLALLIALQAVLLIGLAGISGPPGMN
jgi:hypothetical protein